MTKCIFRMASVGDCVCLNCGFRTLDERLNRDCGTPFVSQSNVYELCIHIGEENGRINCPTCRGSVKVKTFDCAVHERCTLGKALEDVACCAGCSDYRAVQEVPFQGPGNHAATR